MLPETVWGASERLYGLRIAVFGMFLLFIGKLVRARKKVAAYLCDLFKLDINHEDT